VVIFFAVDFVARMVLVREVPARYKLILIKETVGYKYLSLDCRLSGTVSEDWDEEEALRAKKERREPKPEPVQTRDRQLFKFLFSWGTLIDVAAVLPSFIILALRVNSNATSFFRIFRMFRIFKMSKQFMAVIGVFRKALVRSNDAIIILSFGLVVAVVVLGCIEYSVEVGDFVVNTDYPTGAYINRMVDDQTRISPYTSIPVSMYWAVITLSTIGYGKLVR
jgi:hypothetical protein